MKFNNIFFAPFIFLLAGCVNNLSVKTEIGESYYVPKETIFVSSFDKADFLESYEASIESYKVSNTERANVWLDFIEKNKKNYEWCLGLGLGKRRCRDSWKPEQKEIEYKEKYNSIINKMNITLNEMNANLETYKTDVLDGKHWVKIRYKPVFKNLNGRKRPLRKIETACYNPKLKKEIKVIWKQLEKYDFMIYKDVMSGINLETKLCDKYANF